MDNNASASAINHQPSRFSADIEGSNEIHIDELPYSIKLEFKKLTAITHPNVVDQNIKPAICVTDLVECSRDSHLVCNIANQRMGSSTSCSNLGNRLFQGFLITAVDQDACAEPPERFADFQA